MTSDDQQATSDDQQAPDREPRFWINTISLEHVHAGVAAGIVQSDHGKTTRLRWLHAGDWIAMYSPRTGMRAGAVVQAFTAVGRVTGEEPYQLEVSEEFAPWRTRVDWLPCTPAEVRGLLADLDFVIDKARWGYPFRRGLFRIGADDFARIARAMAPDWVSDWVPDEEPASEPPMPSTALRG